MNQSLLNKLSGSAKVLFVAASLAFATQASALAIGDSQELGFVNFGIPSGDSDREAYVNHLIGMALGSSDTALGQDFTRSNNNFGTLPAAVFWGNGSTTTINLGAVVGTYSYIFAKYDGPNFGAEVWYVGNLSGSITIPATGGGYGLSGWTLFTGTSSSSSSTGGPPSSGPLPEPGSSSLALLGLVLLGGVLMKRRLATRA